MSKPCPTCKRDKYISPLDDGTYKCGWCGEILHEKKPEPPAKKQQSKPKSTSTSKNKMETPNDPLDKE